MKILHKKTAAALVGLSGFSALSVTVAHAENVVNNRTNSRVGGLDVYIDDSELQDAISLAESVGLQVFRDATRIRSGNATEVEKHRKEAIQYYKDRAKAIRDAATQYKAALADYEQNKKTNDDAAKLANAELDAYKLSLAALGRGVKLHLKNYLISQKRQRLIVLRTRLHSRRNIVKQLQQLTTLIHCNLLWLDFKHMLTKETSNCNIRKWSYPVRRRLHNTKRC